jgi:nucleotide-binding universal stress UspA family protein
MTTATGFELGSDGPTTLVVGVDGSATSWRALYYAFGLARRQHSKVLAVFAIPAPIAAADGALVGALAETNAQLADELKRAIQKLAADYRVPTKFIARSGDAVNTLIEIAVEHHADALIIGASQTLVHHLIGSKALRTVRRCHCPVTVVH